MQRVEAGVLELSSEGSEGDDDRSSSPATGQDEGNGSMSGGSMGSPGTSDMEAEEQTDEGTSQ